MYGDSGQQDQAGTRVPGEEADDGGDERPGNQGGAHSVQWAEHTPRLGLIKTKPCQSDPFMNRLPGLILALVMVTACMPPVVDSADSAPTPEGSTSAVSTTSPLTETSVATAAPGTTTTIPDGPPVALIAPNGVTLAVTGTSGDSFQVLTPCGDPAVMTAGTPVYEVDVVIDPGHGGPIDTGAVGDNGLHEEDINLQVSRAVHELLLERGVASILTRTADYPVPIRTRSAFSDLVGAEAMVSIHHNAPEALPSEVPGIEIFVKSSDSESGRLGGLIYDNSMAALSAFDVDWDRAPDAGVMTVLNPRGDDAYGMVRLPQAPSALVELGYIANPAEAEFFTDPAYVPTVATAVADGIETFLTTEQTGSPLVEGRVFTPQRGVGKDQCVEPELETSLFPEVSEVTPLGGDGVYSFIVTISSPYDSPERYADAWRVVGDDGVVYGQQTMDGPHVDEQPFTRSLTNIPIPTTVKTVVVQGRDSVYGWSDVGLEIVLP